MHFHYVLLHIPGPWTIHLIGCIFFNKFTTNEFILICFARYSFSRNAKPFATMLPENATELKHHIGSCVSSALSFCRVSSFPGKDFFLAPYLVNHKYITERSSDWSLQSVWPCANRAAAQFWQTGSGPCAEIFQQQWHLSGWHFPHSVCFNEFRFSKPLVCAAIRKAADGFISNWWWKNWSIKAFERRIKVLIQQ